MIEILKKYYGLCIDFYKDYNNGIIFFINGDYYYLFYSYYNEKELKMINEIVSPLKKQIKFHDIVLNNDGNIVSDGYILIKLNYLIDAVNLYDLYRFNINLGSKSNNFFHVKWRDRIDYLEIQLNELCDNKLINNSFDYFSGIAEQLINLISDNYDYYHDTYLIHRISNDFNSIEFYNPININIGNRYNDILSYIYVNSDWNLLYKLLDNIDSNDRIYFFVKLAFPFKYFYYVNLYVTGDYSKEFCIKKIVEEVKSYEKYLGILEGIFKYNVFYWIKKDN